MHVRGSSLKKWHIAIGIIMFLVSATTFALTLYFPNILFPLPLTTDFGGTTTTSFLLPTTWLLAAAALVSSVVHLYYAADKARWRHYFELLMINKDAFNHRMARHVNTVRWCLYAVFGSLLLWPLAQHVGVSNIFLLFGLVVANLYLQRSAYILEIANAMAKNTDSVNIFPFFAAMPAWLFAWATVLVYLFANPSGVSIWIWIAAIGQFLVSVAFGAVALMRYYRIDNMWKKDRNVEKAYILLEILITVVTVVPILIFGLTL